MHCLMKKAAAEAVVAVVVAIAAVAAAVADLQHMLKS